VGNRVQQTAGVNVTQYLLDLQPGLSVVLTETQGANTTRYVHGPTGIHAHKDSANNWEWMVQDGLGSMRGVVDNSVAGLESRLYEPYGVPFGATGTSQTSYGFTGEPTDGNGLLHLRARYYAPNLGVFTALDPFEGKTCTSMSLNGYSWVEGNAINATDPSGLDKNLADAMNKGMCKPADQQRDCSTCTVWYERWACENLGTPPCPPPLGTPTPIPPTPTPTPMPTPSSPAELAYYVLSNCSDPRIAGAWWCTDSVTPNQLDWYEIAAINFYYEFGSTWWVDVQGINEAVVRQVYSECGGPVCTIGSQGFYDVVGHNEAWGAAGQYPESVMGTDLRANGWVDEVERLLTTSGWMGYDANRPWTWFNTDSDNPCWLRECIKNRLIGNEANQIADRRTNGEVFAVLTPNQQAEICGGNCPNITSNTMTAGCIPFVSPQACPESF
jgi:RHS repeat-associated protein